MDYEFKTKPFQHQADAIKESWFKEYYALFMEMGTGKSKVAIDNIGMLYERGFVNAALIIAPKGVYDNWVKGEIPTHLPDRIQRDVLRWEPKRTKGFAKRLEDFVMEDFIGVKIFVMNIEALSTARGANTAGRFLVQNPENIVIVDESTTIKNRKAARTKNLQVLHKYAKYRRILTGSPITKSPMDLFSQCSFLEEKALGYNSYFAFQNRYAIVRQQKMGQRSFSEIVGYRRLDELNEKLTQFSKRVLKSECLDLPDKLYTKRYVALTDEQKRLYDQMKDMALAMLENGELATTTSVLTQIMRLQQISCGHFTPDVGETRSLDSNRLDELLNITEELQGKCIIWASYTHDIQRIYYALRDCFGPEAVALYYGDTKQDMRQDTVERFQDPNNPLRFFVGQPRTGGYGITLTAATTVIYFSNSYDLEIRLQSEDRAHRIGQSNPVTYIDLVSPDTLDEKILTALKNKVNLAETVLGEETRQWFQ
ncbi:MAG: DEAD/DEAH box helicase [Candidatus Bathyarchaeota archaeon]|nr:DEAD/DEAH box helicase [Candidatus Bathyarchaeota archaeon]